MANKVRVWTNEELAKYWLVDTTPRRISGTEIVDIKCGMCLETFQSKMTYVVRAVEEGGYHRYCPQCVKKRNSDKGKGLIGEKNPFYGKNHSDETKTQMKSSSRVRWDNTSEEKRIQIGAELREAAQEKYGGSPMHNTEVRERWRQGIDDFWSNPDLVYELKEKTKATCQEKYGCNSPLENPEVKNKIKATLQERYGVDSAIEIPEVKAKIKATCQERYGCDNPFQNQDVKDKIRDVWRKKYGRDNPGASDEVKDKIKATCQEKYGADSYFASQEFSEKVNENKWFTSKAEIEIGEWLNRHGIEFKKRRLDGVEIDLFIASHGIGIEMHGLYWHSEKYHSKDYHYAKYKYCKDNGIVLIQVFSHEFEKRKKQVFSRLASMLGIVDTKIGARECDVRFIESGVDTSFFNDNHIQGSSHKTIYSIGLYYKYQLVAAASFGRHHRNNKTLVLTRFCTLSGWQVVGALSRITKHASDHFKEDMITWCDLRWSGGNSYLSAGWTKDGDIPPDYFYVKNGDTVVSKQSRRRGVVNTPVGITEHEHALKDGLLRVYDCGKIRFVYKYNG